MKTILIVEDDRFIAELYQEGLNEAGYKTEICANGNSAIARLKKEEPPDLVILDIMLPGTSGPEVLGFIRSEESLKTLPVIVLSNASAYADDLVRRTQMQGANVCLTKAECTPARLLEEVQGALAAVAPRPDSEPPEVRRILL